MGFLGRLLSGIAANRLHRAYFDEVDRLRPSYEPLLIDLKSPDPDQRRRGLDEVFNLHKQSWRYALDRNRLSQPPPPEVEMSFLAAVIAPFGLTLEEVMERQIAKGKERRELDQWMWELKERKRRGERIEPP